MSRFIVNIQKVLGFHLQRNFFSRTYYGHKFVPIPISGG